MLTISCVYIFAVVRSLVILWQRFNRETSALWHDTLFKMYRKLNSIKIKLNGILN